jgi:hypothetical protein
MLLSRMFIGAGILAAGVGVASGQTNKAIVVNDPRPLGDAIIQLERDLRQPITYEDPAIYAYPGDYVDKTAEYRGRATRRVLLPRGGPLQFTFSSSELSGTRAQTTALVKRLVQTFNKAYPDGVQFELQDTGRIYHVVPVVVRTQTGAVVPHVSPLDQPITVVAQDTDAMSAISEILKAVKTQQGSNILVGTVPIELLVRVKVSLASDNESARTLLMRVLQTVSPTLSWRLLCGTEPGCYFNIHDVRTE